MSRNETTMRLANDTIVRVVQQQMPLFVRLPQASPRGVLIVVHGNTRQALLHALRFSSLAAEHGLLLIAPLFERARHPRFRLLERDADGQLTRAVGELLTSIGVAERKWLWFGHSAGAQFVHRYVYRHPEHVERAVLSAAGWYTLPTAEHAFPHGIAGRDDIDLPAALAVPQRVYVGSADVHTGEALRSDLLLDRAQGEHRLARAHTFVGAMRAAAMAHGLEPCVTLREMRSAGHDFDANVRSAGLARRAVRYLLETRHASRPCSADACRHDCSDAGGVGRRA